MFYRKDAKTLRKRITELAFCSHFKPLRLCALAVILFCGCSNKTKTKVDLIVHHAVVYTVDQQMSTQEAFAVKDGKIVAVSTNDSILDNFEAVNSVDAEGKSVFPGFIDSHCHFLHYGLGLNKVDLVGTKSFDEVIARVVAWSKANPNAKWIIGRGWDQNDWVVPTKDGTKTITPEFPDKGKLDSLFPNTPVILKRIDGHAALVNQKALDLANISTYTEIAGGEIQLLIKQVGVLHLEQVPSGILIDNAVDLVEKVIPLPTEEEYKQALLKAQENCFAVGLSTVVDAGLMKYEIDAIDKFQKENLVKMRVYAMLSDSAPNFNYYLQHNIYKTERLNVRSFKFYGDGALGSRGACLIKPYEDKSDWTGFLLKKPAYFKQQALKMLEQGFQMNTHCIGDSANRLMLSIYEHTLVFPRKEFNGKDTIISIRNQDPGAKHWRWRIEHAQAMDPKDIALFKNYIPSVQPTHATSDMYWAKDRLGPERVKYAYAYKELLKAAGLVALGTDFPVENISPFKTFYAAVARMDEKGFPKGGFQMENALTREETLKGMTIWGAFANFEENEKGSIEKGKFADFIILDKDIMKCEIKDVLSTNVISTYINGEMVYQKK